MPSLLLVGGQVGLLCRGDPGTADEDPHVGAEVVLGSLSVLLNTHEVDGGCAAGHEGEVEDEGKRGGGGHHKQCEGDGGVQRPVDHVELHGDQVLVPPPLQTHMAQTLDPRVLIIPKPLKF